MRRAGFSLIELVIVVLIMGTITAIAIPRMVRGSENSGITALKANYALLNRAIGMYAAEHQGVYPSPGNIGNQLLKYSDVAGANFRMSPDPANGIIYGPYLVKIPALTYGPNEGSWKIAVSRGPGVGWIYRVQHKHIVPNLRDGEGELPEGIVEELGWTRGTFDDGGGTEEINDGGENPAST